MLSERVGPGFVRITNFAGELKLVCRRLLSEGFGLGLGFRIISQTGFALKDRLWRRSIAGTRFGLATSCGCSLLGRSKSTF